MSYNNKIKIKFKENKNSIYFVNIYGSCDLEIIIQYYNDSDIHINKSDKKIFHCFYNKYYEKMKIIVRNHNDENDIFFNLGMDTEKLKVESNKEITLDLDYCYFYKLHFYHSIDKNELKKGIWGSPKSIPDIKINIDKKIYLHYLMNILYEDSFVYIDSILLYFTSSRIQEFKEHEIFHGETLKMIDFINMYYDTNISIDTNKKIILYQLFIFYNLNFLKKTLLADIIDNDKTLKSIVNYIIK